MRKSRLTMTMTMMFAALLMPLSSLAAVTLVQTSDAGFYNNQVGTSLNLSNPGGESCAQPFPISNDCSAAYPTAPNLSSASAALGNWLTDPLHLNSNWSFLSAIPNSWAVGTEVAVMYQFNTLGATNVVAKFGVDNGIFVWLDGNYLLGRRDPGSFSLGEYTLNLGNLSAGTHFLQLLLEDHGVTNGYAVNITADSYTPGPPPLLVPEPETYAMLLAGLGLLGFAARRQRRLQVA